MAAAADSQWKLLLAGEPDGVPDVGRAGRLHDQQRSAVDHAVVDGACGVVVTLAWTDCTAFETVG